MNDPASAEPLDLRAYLWPIWRRKWIVLLVTVLAAGGTYYFSSSQSKTYVASTRVYIQVADPTAAIGSGQPSGPPTSQQLQDVATLFTAQSVTATVYRQLGLPIGSAGTVSVSAEQGSSFVVVSATSPSPTLAARLANAYASVFLRTRRDGVISQAHAQRLAAQAALLTLRRNPNDPNASAIRQTLLSQIAELESIEFNPSADAQQIDSATPPSAPTSPHPARDSVFGGVIGLVLGMLMAFGLEMLDNRLAGVEVIEQTFKRPVLTVLPHVDETAPARDGHPSMAPGFVEAMRTLRVQLRLVNRDRSAGTVVVTSSVPREGKSTVTRALALTYAEAGERVLVIDADLRRPRMGPAFGVTSDVGLAQLLQGDVPLAEAAVAVPRAVQPDRVSTNGGQAASSGSIDVVTHGRPVSDPVTILSSDEMRQLLRAASELYDVVIVDTPPLLAVSDALPLLEMVDTTLLVVRLGTSTRNSADRGAEILRRVPDVNLTGIVVNDMRREFAGKDYDAYRSYGYGVSQSTRDEEAARPG